MQQKTEIELGKVKIHNEAISTIASYVVNSIPGVANLSGNIVDALTERFGKKVPDKGIQTEIVGEEVVVNISVIVKFGTKIPEVAWQIQKNVRKAIEEMTGLHVKSINVNVEGVQLTIKKEGDKEIIHEKS